MSLLFTYIFRNIKKNILAVILQIIALSMVVCVIYLNISLSSGIIHSVKQDESDISGGFDICLEAKNKDGVKSADYTFDGAEETLPIGFETYTDGSVYGVNYYLCLSLDLNKLVNRSMITLTEGRLPENSNEAVIFSLKAEMSGLKTGDTFSVKSSTSGQTKEYKICGISSSLSLAENSRPDILEIIVLPSPDDVVQRIYVDCGSYNIEAFYNETRTKYKEFSISVLVDYETEDSINSLRQILLILLGVSVILSFSIIFAVNSSQAEARLTAFAIFRSVGASSRQWKRILYAENAVYALIGGIFGLLSGELSRYLLITYYYKTDIASQTSHPEYLLISFVFSFILQFAVISLIKQNSSKLSIRASLIEKPTAAAKISTVSTVMGFVFIIVGSVLFAANSAYNVIINEAVLLSLIIGLMLVIPFLAKITSDIFSSVLIHTRCGSLFLAVRNFSSSKFNISSLRLTATVFALSTLCIFTISSINAFFTEYSKNFDFDVFIRGTDLSDEECDYALKLDGVDFIQKEYWYRMDVDINSTEKARLCFVKNKGYLNGISFYGKTDSDLKEGEIIIDKLYAKLNNIGEGDVLSIFFSETSEKTGYFTVAGFCDSGIYNTSRKTVIMCDNDYFNYVYAFPTRIDITLKDGYSAEKMLSMLKPLTILKLNQEIEVGLNTVYIGKEQSATYNALKVFSFLPVFILLLSVIGLVNNQVITFKYRKRSYAVLYSVAMNRRQLFTGIILETVIMFVFGAIIGSLFGLYETKVIQNIFYMLFAYIEMQIPITDLCIFIPLCGIAIIGVSVLPSISLFRMNIAKEIREEE